MHTQPAVDQLNQTFKWSKRYELDQAGKKTSRARIMHWCPGCKDLHSYSVNEGGNNNQRPAWTFNNDYKNPTFSPSYRAQYQHWDTKQMMTLCHTFVTEGKIDFCDDCPHELNGKKGVEIPLLPDWMVEDSIANGGELF